MPGTCRYLSRSTSELTRSIRSRWLAEQVWLGRRLYALRVLLSGSGLNSLDPAFLSRCVSICLRACPASAASAVGITTGSSMLRSDVSTRACPVSIANALGMILTAPPHASQVDMSISPKAPTFGEYSFQASPHGAYFWCAFMPSGAGHRGVTTCGYAVICFTAFLAHVALAASCRCHQYPQGIKARCLLLGRSGAFMPFGCRRTRHGSVSDWLAVWALERQVEP